jgi:hypothetical protein
MNGAWLRDSAVNQAALQTMTGDVAVSTFVNLSRTRRGAGVDTRALTGRLARMPPIALTFS